MRIVFLNQFYPPDFAPTGVMLESVAEKLGREGHSVTVICSGASYNAQKRGTVPENTPPSGPSPVRMIRIPAPRPGPGHLGKLITYFGFYAGVAWRLLWTRADLVVALTTPPYLSLLARFMTKWRGGRHAHWVMDLYPDVMVAHGMLRPEGWPHKLLRSLTRWGFGGRRCGGVITLGPDMAAGVQACLPPGVTAAWVPLWGTAGESPLPGEVSALRAERGWRPGEVVFLYSGNMGLGHRFSDILAAGGATASGGFRLAFFGGGKRRGEIAAAVAAGSPVLLGDYVEHRSLAAHLASGDVHLASLEPAWDGTMVPSKLQGIFAAGRPVLFTGSRNCSIGRWILQSGAGWVCAPGDLEAHAAALKEAMDPAQRAARGAAALAFAASQFDREKNTGKIAEFFKEAATI